MSLFDTHIVVDWSASGVPKRGPDSIWIATATPDTVMTENPATRAEAMKIIAETLDRASAAGARVLIGFDFAFGYPAAFSAAFGTDWRDVWAAIAAEIEDGPRNATNRFHAAARLNAQFPGDGPFWGNGLKQDIPGLPRKKPGGWGETLPPNRRWTDTFNTKAQEVWKLSGAGSVGSQALTGIAALERLRQARNDVQVWPFETFGEGRTHVLAEVFPSLVEMTFPEGSVKDEVQVRTLATLLRDLDARGELATLLERPARLGPDVCSHEAAMIGVETPEKLRPSPRRTPARRLAYMRNQSAIVEKATAAIRAEARLDRFPPALQSTAIRIIDACGMAEVADRLVFTPNAAEAGIAALANGAPIFCDHEMTAAGIERHLPQGNEVICTLNHPATSKLAAGLDNTRAAAAVELWADRLNGAVVAFGRAPSALFHLLEMLDQGAPKPALILGFPVGFVDAAASKAQLAANPRGCDFITLRGRKGGAGMASAAVNALAAGLAGESR